MNACGHKDKLCAISGGPCPGVCVYADILGNISLGIIILDVNKKTIVYQNKCVVDIFNPALDITDFDTLCALLLPDLDRCLAMARPSFSREFEFAKRLFGYTVYNVVRGFIWIFISDVTEKERLRSVAEALNTMDNIGFIFSGIRHEIGNPVNSIKMTMSVLKKHINVFNKDTINEYIDRTLSEITRIEYLFNSLKNFNMFEEVEPRGMDIQGFLRDFLSLARKDFEARGINIAFNVEPGAELVHADPRALQQVLLNLVTNAADALEASGRDMIDIRVSRDADVVKVRVSDNGCGISHEEQKDIFKPFFTTKRKGTGLGLVIARNMVAKMKGTIEIESFENIGTIVTLTLPVGSAVAEDELREAGDLAL